MNRIANAIGVLFAYLKLVILMWTVYIKKNLKNFQKRRICKTDYKQANLKHENKPRDKSVTEINIWGNWRSWLFIFNLNTLYPSGHRPTCLQCSVDISLIELPLGEEEEVVSLSPSPSIICETTSCRQNFLLQQTSQSRSGLWVKQIHIFCQHAQESPQWR